MSKKIAAGADKIVLDVTVWKRCIYENKRRCKNVSKGNDKNRKISRIEKQYVYLTNMDEPLGYAVGNTLEVIEAINCLKGDMPEDCKRSCFRIRKYI